MENTTKQPTERPEDRAFGVETVKPIFGKKGFGNLLKLYLYRVLHDKLAYAILIIIFALAFIVILFGWNDNETAKQTAIQNGTQVDLTFSISMISLSCFSTPNTIVSTLSAFNNLVTQANRSNVYQTIFNSTLTIGFVSLIYISAFFGREWHNRTLRNQILSGHSRFQIFLASFAATAIWCLVGVAIWEIVVWGFGSALGIPAFLTGQYGSYKDASFYSYGGTLALSFFMELLIYLTYAAIALSWVYIIGNSWGALGLFVATIFAFDIFYAIIYGVGVSHSNTYYKFMECLFPYQNSAYLSCNPDTTAEYVAVSNGSGGKYFKLQAVYDRTLILAIKTICSSVVLIGGMGGLGYLAFYKKDLK
jgi:hypothetical protein